MGKQNKISDPNSSLDELRLEIDRIDDAIHDLLLQRTDVVGQIGAMKEKSNEVVLRPGREAEIVRRLISRHRGSFPKSALVRIWRELMGALVGLQGPFSMAVATPDNGGDYVELARNHFGTIAPVSTYRSPGQVVRAVADGSCNVGILPLPGDNQPDSAEAWWLALMPESPEIPRIIARLPFANGGRADALEALVIGRLTNEATGFDRTWMVVETDPDVSRTRLKTVLTAAGLEPSQFAATHHSDGHWLHLVEVIGHAATDDRRVARLIERKGQVRYAAVLGSHAVPLGIEELSE